MMEQAKEKHFPMNKKLQLVLKELSALQNYFVIWKNTTVSYPFLSCSPSPYPVVITSQSDMEKMFQFAFGSVIQSYWQGFLWKDP